MTVPQVASDATTAAYMPAPPTQPRAASNSDGAPDLPFDSLLDDGTQAAAAPRPQAPRAPADTIANATQPDQAAAVPRPQAPPAPADTIANAAQPDSAQPPAHPNGGKAANASGSTNTANATASGKAAQTSGNTNAAEVDTTASNDKVAANSKVKAEAKYSERTKAGDTSKPAGDGKPADAAMPIRLTADPTSSPVQIVPPAAVVATAPAPGAVIPPATGRASQAAPVTTQAAIVAADAPKPKASDLAAAQDGTDKPATAHPDDDVSTATPHAPARTTPPAITDEATAPKPAGDAVQQASLTPPSPDVSPATANSTVPAPTAVQPAPIPSAAAVPIAGVAVEIASMAQAGKNHFEIRLDPPELGHIEVHLDVDRDGQTTTRLIADRSDTLDLLRRDSAGLERSLQDAGLKTSDNGLQFSLRDQTMGREQSSTPAPSTAQIVVQDNTLPTNSMTQGNYSRLAGLRGGIDIRI